MSISVRANDWDYSIDYKPILQITLKNAVFNEFCFEKGRLEINTLLLGHLT